MISITKINRDFSFLTKRYYGLSDSQNTAFSSCYPKWFEFGRCFVYLALGAVAVGKPI